MSLVKENFKKKMSPRKDNSKKMRPESPRKDNSKKMKPDNDFPVVRKTRKNRPETVKVVSFNQYPYKKCINVSNVWNLQCTINI